MPGTHKYATLRDVARCANTSTATVSYVLNGDKERYISDELRERVLNAAKKLNYVKSALASGLRGKKRGIIAIMVPQFTNIFFSRLILGVEEVAKENGYILSVCNTFDDATREKEILEMLMGQRMDGFILIPTEKGYENYESVRRLDLPYVIAERPLARDTDCDFISMDNYDAGYTATNYLLERGHRHIGLISWDTAAITLKDRRVGYADALEKAGVPYRPEYISLGDFSPEFGYAATGALLEQNPQLTAIVYGYHVQAQGGITRLHELQVKIPDDLSVIMIGDPEWITINDPPFTAVELPAKEVGRTAAEVLFGKILHNENYSRGLRTMYRGKLAEGNSVKTL